MNIGDKISKAIKEGKWLEISYINQNAENTFYWIAIQDIDFINQKLFVSIFNDKKSFDVFNSWIYFNNIKDAKVIEFSSYDTNYKLINKIERNLDKCEWLSYEHFNNNILNYYDECNIFDNDPFQKEYSLIPGIDLAKLRKDKIYKLNNEQTKRIISDIYHYDIKSTNNTFYTLAINCFSISEGKNKYLICYYILTFDPIKQSLVLDKNLHFNQTFLIEGRRHSLFNYIKMDMDEFCKTFITNFLSYQKLISENLKANEFIDTRPDMMLIQRDIPINLYETYNVIEEKYLNNELPIPLKAFFGNIRKYNRKKEPSLIIYDKRININQMRVLYNALKYPITYVQGPPGTGKTQTIINVVLSALYNEKTMLICSSNNKPVDGIVEKLVFSYKNETVNFPFLRLGNFDDVKKATLRIKELYSYSYKFDPKDELLEKIKISTDDKNAKLIQLLNSQEKRIDIESCLESSKKLIASFDNNTSKIVEMIKQKISELEANLNDLPEVSNEEITSLFIPLNENYQLSQYLFFKSLQYIYNLKKPKYAKLIEICYIKDDNERATEFNKWSLDDDNMKMLVDVFPIIFSTNISSRRLGSPKFMFDLVVMDEAGQCNVATSLIPIAKANSLLLVGDPNQLKPVIVLEDLTNNQLMEKYNVPANYDYKTHSILDVMLENDNISKYILLKYHYRCGRKIINFSNQRFYNNSLNLSFIKNDGEIKVLDVKNKNVKQKNEAFDEANEIVNYIIRNDIDDTFIITPFVNQKELIQKLLKERNVKNVECGTIHQLQGAERNTIILSSALSPKTSKKAFNWLKNNHELINVAITRAKNKIIIATDTEVLNTLSDKTDDLYNLIQYAKNNCNIEVPANEAVKMEIGKSNGSTNEDEFYKTISHFCTCNKSFEATRNISIAKVFKDKVIPAYLNDYEFDLVLYETNIVGAKKPVIAFEVNGPEHLGEAKREKSDKEKIKICNKYGLKLIFISNSFVKAYEYIASIIMSSKNKEISIQQTLFDDDYLNNQAEEVS